MKQATCTILLLFLIASCLAIDPPVYNFSFHVTFDEIFVVNNTNYEVNGQTFYDPINNR